MSRGGRIGVAVALGLLAALFGMLYLSSQRDELVGTSDLVRVYVATRDIKPNSPLEPSMLTTREIPRRWVQPQSMLYKEFQDPRTVTGLVVVPIQEGEQILRTKLIEGAVPPLSADLRGRTGTVAVSVEMHALPQSVHGLIKPGDHVDVLASFKFEKSKVEDFTEVRPLFQNLQVLAVNELTGSTTKATGGSQRDEPQDRMAKTVTLAATPAIAQQLILAQQLGNVWLLLRAPDDNTTHQYEIWNNERLLQSPYKLWQAGAASDDVMQQLMKR
jgi:Flp pilus assembly protein CpaB